MTPCDLLVSAHWLLPIAPENSALEQHALAITDGAIVAVGPAEELQKSYEPDERLDLNHHVVLPGLVNAHGHAAMTLLRGAGEDQSLQAWLADTIWPLEGRLVSADFVRLGTTVAIAEMLASGTTTFSDMYFFPEDCADVADNLGVRAQVCFPVIEMTNVWSDGVADCLHKGLALSDTYRHHNRIDIAFGPHAAYTVSAESLEKVTMYANEIDAQVQIHLHENLSEVEGAIEQHGQTWIKTLSDVGLLGPNLQAIHMTEVNDEDRALIAQSHTRVVHCPKSNLKLASGYSNIAAMRESGITVGLGTDGAASNNTLNLFTEAHIASLMAKHESRDPTQGNAQQTIAMATLEGAKVLGIDDKVGSLEAGKQADFIAVDLNRLSMLPSYDPFAALLHGDAGNQVTHAFVSGQALYKNREFTRLDLSELTAKVREWQSASI